MRKRKSVRLVSWPLCVAYLCQCLLFLALCDLRTGEASYIISINAGENITLRCDGRLPSQKIVWIGPKQYRLESNTETSSHMRFMQDGRLSISNVSSASDAGLYDCQDVESNQSVHAVTLRVVDVPAQLANMSVDARDLFAIISWKLGSKQDGLRPVDSLVLRYYDTNYGEATSVEVLNISTSSNARAVYHLNPNTTYVFMMYATNHVGPGPVYSQKVHTDYINGVKAIQDDVAKEFWVLIIVAILTFFGIIGLAWVIFVFMRWFKFNFENSHLPLDDDEDDEVDEDDMAPHITLNPSFNIEMLEFLSPTSDESSSTAFMPSSVPKCRQKSNQSNNAVDNDEQLNIPPSDEGGISFLVCH